MTTCNDTREWHLASSSCPETTYPLRSQNSLERSSWVRAVCPPMMHTTRKPTMPMTCHLYTVIEFSTCGPWPRFYLQLATKHFFSEASKAGYNNKARTMTFYQLSEARPIAHLDALRFSAADQGSVGVPLANPKATEPPQLNVLGGQIARCSIIIQYELMNNIP